MQRMSQQHPRTQMAESMGSLWVAANATLATTLESSIRSMSEACDEVVIDHTSCLHHRIASSRTNESKT